MLDNVGEKNYRVLLLKLKFLLILLGTIGGSAIASMSVFISTITGLLIFIASNITLFNSSGLVTLPIPPRFLQLKIRMFY